MGNTDPLPSFTDAEDLAFATRMHAAAIVRDAARSEYFAAVKPLLLINLGKLFTKHTCLQAVEFKAGTARSASDSPPSIETGCEVGGETDRQREAEAERAWEKLGNDWGHDALEALLPDGRVTREELARRLAELRSTLDAERAVG
jgi:hypothetical protein